MHLSKLSLVNFKNCPQAELEFSPRINCFVGDNGQGKTNLLDAIHHLCFCKSHFPSADSHNIRHGQKFFVLQGTFCHDGPCQKVHLGFKRGHRKTVKRDQYEYKKLSEHIGLFPLVMLTPSDIGLVAGAAEERRIFLDTVISQYDSLYLAHLIDYHKALAQRNTMLKDARAARHIDRDLLAAWDHRLALAARPIFLKRAEFVREVQPLFHKFYRFVAGSAETPGLEYKSALEHDDLATLLEQRLEKDLILGHTTAGVHRDELELLLDGHPLRRVASQGQQKTFLLALKLAQFDFMRAVKGKLPLLLLDDIFDKLDPRRVAQIVQLVAQESFGQVFITDTQPERMNRVLEGIGSPARTFRVVDGIPVPDAPDPADWA